MKPNQKSIIETLLYSTAGIGLVFILLLGINLLLDLYLIRWDLTQEKAYTLSEGTKQLLKSLDTPVKIRFYCTRTETATPEVVYLRNFARRVEDLLAEYKQIAGRKLIIEKYDPQPDSDAEDSARMDGIEPRQLPAVDRFYLGLCVSLGDQRETIPFIEPTMERLLEYQITRAIARVVNPTKPVIGILSSLPVFGMPFNPARQNAQPIQQWAFINELKFDYDVRKIDVDTEKIDDDVQLLLVVHPKNLSEKTQYAIDQFLMRGGRLMICLDPLSVVDNRLTSGPFGFGTSSSNLEKLLKAWGYSFDSTKAVADVNFMLKVRARTGLTEDAPVWLNVAGPGINPQDVATANIESVWLPVVGAFTGQPTEGIKETVLLQSTDKSQLVDAFMANMSGSSILRDFRPSGVNYKLALKLSGKFKSAFPEGKPNDGQSTNETTQATSTNQPTLKESVKETSVVLFGDADFLYDDFSIRKIDTPFGQLVAILNGNLALMLNLVDQLAGDTRLIAIRSRAEISRPFTRIRDMVVEAEQRFQAEIKRLEDFISETQRRINELQAQKTDAAQKYILSPEQRAELEKLRREEAQTRQRLKQVRKELTHAVRSLENRIKWINMTLMPAIVALTGVVIAIVRHKQTAAK